MQNLGIQIKRVPHLNGDKTPVRCNRRTGEIWINESVFNKLPPAHRLFILLHEYGHIALNSSDEFAVDEFASKLYIKLGYSLTESVKALSQVLTGNNPDHIVRVKNQLERAKNIDMQHNGNKLEGRTPWYDATTENFTDSLFGLGKRAKEKRAIRDEKKRANIEIKKSAAQAKLILAQQGISEKALGRENTRNVLGGVLGSATSIVGGIFGGGAAAGEAGAAIANSLGVPKVAPNGDVYYEPQPMGLQQPTEAKKSKWMIPGIIGGVLLLGIIGFIIYKKRK